MSADAQNPQNSILPENLLPIDTASIEEIRKSLLEMNEKFQRLGLPTQMELINDAVTLFMSHYCAVLASLAESAVVVYRNDDRGRLRHVILKQTAFLSSYKHLRFTMKIYKVKANGELAEKEVSIVLPKVWLESPKRRTFQGMGMYETSSCPKNHLNLWYGLPIDNDSHARFASMGLDELAIITEPFFGHIQKKWCRQQQRTYVYLVKLLATMIQHPLRKIPVAVVLHSAEGAGKTIIITMLGRLYGSHYSAVDREAVFGSFNDVLRDCMLLLIEEYDMRPSDSSKMKALITEPTWLVRKKRCPDVSLPTPRAVFINTNRQHAVYAGPGARRFLLLEVDGEFSGASTEEKCAYFRAIASVPVEAIYEVLMRLDISDFQPQNVPVTDELREQIRLSFGPVERWWHACLREAVLLPGGDHFGSSMSESRLTSLFKAWNQRSGGSAKRISDEEFWLLLEKLVPSMARTVKRDGEEQVTCIVTPGIESARSDFRRYLSDPDWPFPS